MKPKADDTGCRRKFNTNSYHCKCCGQFAKCEADRHKELTRQIQDFNEYGEY